VLNKMRVRRNPDVPAQPLRLDGEELNLARVLVNGQGASFKMEGQQAGAGKPAGSRRPGAFELEIFTTCIPAKNTKLMGLYVSNDSFFTQCEAEGFRRITYFLDRPDVMASYTVTLRADKARYPVLLSNGNLVEQGDAGPAKRRPPLCALGGPAPQAQLPVCAGGRAAGVPRAAHHLARRQGPPAAGLCAPRRPGQDRTRDELADGLVAWDEARFGLPLDLERFMIVATSDFNMGAMENKGLNIFNTKYVLASQATATDTDFRQHRERGGPRIFPQLDRQPRDLPRLVPAQPQGRPDGLPRPGVLAGPGADASARAVKRIEDVRVLRTAQFPEDAGPMAHPVRPDSTWRSTTSTPSPSTKKAPKSCA
jgi:aminopeptidase N